MRIHVKHIADREGVQASLEQIDDNGITHGTVTVSRSVRFGEMQKEPVFNWRSSSMASPLDEAQAHVFMMQHALILARQFADPLWDAPREDLLGEDRYKVVIAEYDLPMPG